MISNLIVHSDKKAPAHAHDWQCPITFQVGRKTFTSSLAWDNSNSQNLEWTARRQVERIICEALTRSGYIAEVAL